MQDQVTLLVSTASKIKSDLTDLEKPPLEPVAPSTEEVLHHSIIKGTRGYIEKVVYQVNGTYHNSWYDACAVMIRRLVETLIIEAFEHKGIANKIKNHTGDFFHLKDLIDAAINEPSWNLSRNAKQALPKLKNVGDLSAHNRRYIAHRPDIEKLIPDLRMVAQEFIHLASLK